MKGSAKKETKALPVPARAPDEKERLAIDAARDSISKLSPRFEANTKAQLDGDTLQIRQGPKHSDMEGWKARLVAAFGTSSSNVVNVEIERIAAALRHANGNLNAAELDTVIAIVSGQQPKDELEAMVICQMAVTHALTLRSLGNLNRSKEIQQQDSNALAIARLTKAFASQVDALAKLRRGGEQRVVVEHVHVYPGGQAIVGTVNHAPGTGGVLGNGAQPHAGATGREMRGQDAIGSAMPVISSRRPQKVSNARRGTRIRGALG